MIENSVLGKSWISKKYNEETVSFLKNNFSLSEILSRLIAIRDIKIEDIDLIKSMSKNTPLLGRKMKGKVEFTINKGFISKHKD